MNIPKTRIPPIKPAITSRFQIFSIVVFSEFIEEFIF